MSNRDFAVVALGRFLVVERYRETCMPAPISQLPSRRQDRTGGYPDKPGSSSGRRAPVRPQRG
jgi:hypothetical protein